MTLGPENAAILSRLLAKPPAQATEPLKPMNVMLADALRALAPSDPSAGKDLNGALSAPNPPALQTVLAQGPLNPAGQAAQAQNPLVAALMAMRPGGSTAPAAAAYQQA